MLAAVVLDALGAPLDPELDRAVGPGAAQRLRRELRAVARRWAAALAPGRAFEATSGAAAASRSTVTRARGAVAPDIPSLGPAHARSVLEDLQAGTALAIGSAHDGRPYLVVLAAFDARARSSGAPIGWEALMAAAAERDLRVAMLRPERRLASAADARALALDPLGSGGRSSRSSERCGRRRTAAP